MSYKYIYIFITVLLAFTGCRIPFFPETGKPTKSHHSRSTPEGLISQLVQSYESRRRDLFEDLLADSFRFYVAPSFKNAFIAAYPNSDREAPDTALRFIDNSESYYFWTKSLEIQSHSKLLSNDKVSEIKFYSPLEISSKRYAVAKNGDTVNVELLTNGGAFEIRITHSATEMLVYAVSIEKQVFYLERDSERLWVIRKWYDLSSAPNLEE